MEGEYDLIIIGGAPAAISAGIYAARKRIKVLLICQDWGGQMILSPEVQNYPGFERISGLDLVNKFVAHLKKNQLDIKEGAKVEKIEQIENDRVKVVVSAGVEYFGKALILATGRVARKLGLAREEEFIGRGISYCATCDAPMLKNKSVAVIGSGNAGAATALETAAYAKKIYLLSSKPELVADSFFIDMMRERSPQIEIINNAEVKEFKGEKFISGLAYEDKNTKATRELAVEGIFIAIGSTANSFLLQSMVELNEKNEVKVDCNNQTSVPYIFAAGDVTDVAHKQIVIAAGDGAKAALSAYKYLQKIK